MKRIILISALLPMFAHGQYALKAPNMKALENRVYVIQSLPPAYQIFTMVAGVPTAVSSTLTTGQIANAPSILAKCQNAGVIVDCSFSGGGGGDTITSPNGTINVGGTSSATTLDVANPYPKPVTVAATSATDIEITTCFSPAYKDYQIRGDSLILSAGANDIVIQYSVSAGVWDTTTGHYGYGDGQGVYGGGGTVGNGFNASTTSILLTGGNGQAGSPNPVNVTLTLHDVNNNTTSKFLDGTGHRVNTGPVYTYHFFSGIYIPTTPLLGIRFLATGGANIIAGSVTCQPLPQ